MRTITVDDSVTAVQWTPAARQTWENMGERMKALVRWYGDGSREALQAAVSYVQVSTSIIGWGDVRVMPDGELSLFCNANGFVFGIIWHEDKRTCTNDGCKAYCGDNGWYTYSPDDKRCEGPHVPSIPMDAPMPGTWSFHS